jgi:hypothetical protein
MVECGVIRIVIRGVHHFSRRLIDRDWLIKERLHLFLWLAFALWKIACAGGMDFHSNDTFDALPELAFHWAHQRDSDSALSGAAGTADTVNVVFLYRRELEVDDVGQAWDVQTACCDIGCDQQAHTAIPELLEGCFALILGSLTVDCGARDAIFLKLLCETLGAVACAAEDDCLVNGLVLDQPHQEVALLFLLDFVDALLNESAWGIRNIYSNALVVLSKELIGEADNCIWVGRREKHPLIDLRESGHDVADVANKAHIQHPVCFIQDDLGDTAEVGVAMSGEVEEATRGCDEDVDAKAEGLDLLTHVDAAVDDEGAEVRRSDKASHGLLDLDGELTCRGKNQQAWSNTSGCDLLIGQHLNHRQRKCRRLTGACRRTNHHITAGEYTRDGL